MTQQIIHIKSKCVHDLTQKIIFMTQLKNNFHDSH